jgi:type I restriction enzyme M protein
MENFDSRLRNSFRETLNVLNKESFINKTEESFSIGFYLILIYKLGFFNKMIVGKTLIQAIDKWKEAEKISFQFAFDRIERQIEKLSKNAIVEIETIFSQLGQYDAKRYSETIIKEVFEEFFVMNKNRHDSLAILISLGKVITSLAKIEKGSTVFNPFAGSGSLTIALDPEIDVLSADLNLGTIELLNLRKNAWEKNDNYFIMRGDCINHFNPSNKQYDLIVSMPPVLKNFDNQEPHLIHYSSLIDLVIDSSLKALKSSGKAALIIPTSYLNAENIKDNSRRRIIDEDLIDTIINLPPGAAENTSIRFSLLFLNKRKVNPGKIRMVDGNQYILDETKKYPGLNVDLLCKDLESSITTERKIGHVNLDEIKDQSNNLSPDRYLIPKFDKDNSQHFLLSSILGVIKHKEYPLEAFLHHVGLSDLKSNAFDYELNAISPEVNYAQFGGTLIEEDCLLIASKGASLKPTYFKYDGKPVLVAPDIFCFKIDTSLVNIDYFIYQLYTNSVKKQIAGYRSGSVLRKLHLKDLLNVFIELPSLEDQTRIYSLLLENEKGAAAIIDKLEIENKKLQDELYAQSAFLRHTLAGPLSNIRAAISNIEKSVKSNFFPSMSEVLNFKLNPTHEFTFGKWLEVLRRDVQIVSETIATTTPEQNLLNAQLEKILIAEFVRDYCAELKTKYPDEFDLDVSIDDSLILDDNNLLREVHIMATPQMLTILLDNIVENAIKHAFVEGEERRLDFYLNVTDDDEPKVHLEIGNSGKPFPADFDFMIFKQKGRSYGPNGGSGYGGWLINQIQERICDNFDIINEPKEIFSINGLATSFNFNFKIAE